MKRILIVGENSLVAKNFINQFENKYEISKINKNNSDRFDIILEEFSALVFLAQSSDYKEAKFTQDLFDVNVKLLHRLLSAYIGKTKNIVYFSSGSVYNPSEEFITEQTPQNFSTNNPYVASKLMGELIVQSFKSFFDSITIVRPFFIYGKDQKENMLFQALLNNIRNGNTITLNGGKGLIFNPIHAQDVAEFIHYVIQEEFQGLRTVNLFGPEQTDISKVVAFMEEELQQKANIVSNSSLSPFFVAKTLNPIGFQPKIGVHEGLKKMIHNL